MSLILVHIDYSLGQISLGGSSYNWLILYWPSSDSWFPRLPQDSVLLICAFSLWPSKPADRSPYSCTTELVSAERFSICSF